MPAIVVYVSPAMWPNPVKDSQYMQRIRKHKPSSLLPLIARTATRYLTKEQWIASPYRVYMPWALADVARVAITRGTEFNRGIATDADLLAILGAYSELDDPFRLDKDLHAFLLRKAGEQLTWQFSDFQMMSRTIALFNQTTSKRVSQCLVPGWDIAAFGCPLKDYIGTAQLVWASALKCSGYFNPAFFDTDDGKIASRVIERSTVLHIIDTHFAGDTATFRQEETAVSARMSGRDPQLRRYTYNPLRGRPLLTGYGTGYLCPVPQLLPSKVGPLGIYFSGLSYFKDLNQSHKQFTIEIGYLFEEYIGRNLQLIPDAAVLPEIIYTVNRSEARSVDWIVIFHNLVLLVEVKSAIPTEPVRLGTADAGIEIIKKIKKAYLKIDETANLIKSCHPGFSAVPAGIPILGMVVTLESYYTGNSSDFRSLLPVTATKISLVDAAEVEAMVTIDDISIGDLLLERDADPERSTWALTDILKSHSHRRNPVLNAGWTETPWASANRLNRGALREGLQPGSTEES
jgi:hypothetical protein